MGFESPTRAAKLQRQRPKNHKSANLHSRRTLVEKELKTSKKPAIISPLGAIPKDDGSVRLSHDGSLPEGFAMNEYTDHHSVRYQTLQDACRLAEPGYYCAKLDLQSAYRSVPIHPDDYKATGLAWRFEGEDTDTYLFDARLPFGSACGPSHFGIQHDVLIKTRLPFRRFVLHPSSCLSVCEVQVSAVMQDPVRARCQGFRVQRGVDGESGLSTEHQEVRGKSRCSVWRRIVCENHSLYVICPPSFALFR